MILLASAALGFSVFAPVAAVADASSGISGTTVLGYHYSWSSYIYTSTPTLQGSTTIAATAAPPSGWMGANARIYRGVDGALMISSGFGYLSNSWTEYARLVGYSGTSGIAYYSQGQVDMWNGSGYNRSNSPRTPNQTWY